MSFDSIFFLSCFLPPALALYWLIPGTTAKNGILLVISLVFYAFGSIPALGLLLLAALFNYLFGQLILGFPGKKILVALGVGANLLFLGAFKYLNFLLTGVLGLEAVELGLAVPLGMSFFVFKSISYLVDLHRQGKPQRNGLFDFMLYLSFFPQVSVGPIARYDQFSGQLAERSLTTEGAARGMRRFIVGLSKKVLLCGALSTLADGVFGLEAGSLDLRLAWLAAIAYSLQIYFDFSGYSDMAIGLGGMLGFESPENFCYPYTARSLGEFWRRWHMSLSGWFRDYLYIPLGGNRKGTGRTALHKALVFLLCGLWHGAAWTFVVWGLWHGLFSALESLGIIPVKKLEKTAVGRLLGRVYTLLVVCLGFVMFRAETVGQGLTILGAMFSGSSLGAQGNVLLFKLFNWETAAAMLIGAVLCLPVKQWLEKRFPRTEAAAWVLCLLLLAACILHLASGGFAPAIYAGF